MGGGGAVENRQRRNDPGEVGSGGVRGTHPQAADSFGSRQPVLSQWETQKAQEAVRVVPPPAGN